MQGTIKIRTETKMCSTTWNIMIRKKKFEDYKKSQIKGKTCKEK